MKIFSVRTFALPIIAGSAFLLNSCATVILPVPNQADAGRASDKFPGTTMADLDRGKVSYERNCQRCHSLVDPKSESEAEWREIVPIMAKKAKIDAETENLILRYVVVMSAHTPQ